MNDKLDKSAAFAEQGGYAIDEVAAAVKQLDQLLTHAKGAVPVR